MAVNLWEEAAFQFDVFHPTKGRSPEWTYLNENLVIMLYVLKKSLLKSDLFNEDCDNFCRMGPCILPYSFLATVGHWKIKFLLGHICRGTSPLSSIHSDELSISPRLAANPLLQEYWSTTTPVTNMACRAMWHYWSKIQIPNFKWYHSLQCLLTSFKWSVV